MWKSIDSCTQTLKSLSVPGILSDPFSILLPIRKKKPCEKGRLNSKMSSIKRFSPLFFEYKVQMNESFALSVL